MHRAAVLGAAALLFSTAIAAPVKREVEVETVTQVELVVEMVTATVWVDPTDAPVAAVVYTPPAAPTTTDVAPVVYHASPPAITSSTQAPAPAPPAITSSTQAPAPAPPAPTTTSTSTPAPAPAPPAPTTSSIYVAPAAVTNAYVPPPVPVITDAQPTTTAQPAPTSQAPPAAAPKGNTYSGDITYYDVGLGSCGITNTDSDMVVAMSAALMDKATMCGKTITLSLNGITQTATVVDTCPGCASGSLDLSPALFKAIAPTGDGRVHNIQWWFN